MKENAPCMGCPNRHLGCHDQCEDYKAWQDRYRAQQKHLADNKYRTLIPMSPAREKTTRTYLKFGQSHKQGGNQ